MNTLSGNFDLADKYFSILKNLSADIKLDLISKLSQSLKQTEEDKSLLQSLYGAWKSEESADELIAEIKASRVSNRNIEPL